MFNWLRGKVSGEVGSSGNGQYDSLSKDEGDGKSTLVVVRDAAVPKMTLESNELQLLRDIPEFKPLLNDGAQPLPKLDAKSMLMICKIYQEHLHSSAESVAVEQRQLTAGMKEIDLAVKVMMDRLTDRQKAYAKAAEQVKRTSDITQSLKKMRYNILETEEMLRQLNEQLPEHHRLAPFQYSVSLPD